MAVSAVSLSYGHLRSITCTTDSYCNMYHLVYMFVKTYQHKSRTSSCLSKKWEDLVSKSDPLAVRTPVRAWEFFPRREEEQLLFFPHYCIVESNMCCEEAFSRCTRPRRTSATWSIPHMGIPLCRERGWRVLLDFGEQHKKAEGNKVWQQRRPLSRKRTSDKPCPIGLAREIS